MEKNIQMPLDIQLFAEVEEDKDNGTPTTEKEENKQAQEPVKKEEKTYTRDELEKIKAQEREATRKAILKELEEKQKLEKAEAERLAKMDEEQKKSYEVDKVTKERDSAISELNAYKLKEEATKQAREKGVDLDLMDTIDYTKETAESVKSKIDIFANTSKKISERAISEYSKEPTPQTGDKINPNDNKTGYEKFAEKFEK